MLHRYMHIQDKNNGFTFIEVLITILIFSIVSIPVLTVFSRIIHVAEKIKTANRYTRELITINDYLEKSISGIQFPFWLNVNKDSPYFYSKNSIEIPYWKGKKDSSLIITCKDGILAISSPLETRVFKGWENFTALPLQDNEGRITGIILTLKRFENTEVRFLCAFGAIGHNVFNGTGK